MHLADGNHYRRMTSVMGLDGVTWFLCSKDVTDTCKRTLHSPTIGEFLHCNGGKLEEAEDFNVFLSLLCVRIEIDQLGTKINHSICTLVI